MYNTELGNYRSYNFFWGAPICLFICSYTGGFQWMYIVPVVVFVVISNAMTPEGGGEG